LKEFAIQKVTDAPKVYESTNFQFKAPKNDLLKFITGEGTTNNG